MRLFRSHFSLLLAGSLALMAAVACAPGARVVSPPTFRLDAAASGFVSIDPPGVGDGTALFRVALIAENPNPIGVKLASLDGSLFFREVRAAAVSFRGGIDLPGYGSAQLLLDVRVPLGAAPALLDALAALVGGSPVRYRVEAAVGIELLGTVQRFPSFTLAQGELSSPLVLVAPRLSLVASTLRFEAVNRVSLRLELDVFNAGVVGYLLRSPQISLLVGGAEAASVALAPTAVPATGAGSAILTFSFDPLRLGPALVAQIQAASAGAAGLSISLSGAWSLEAPGLASLNLNPATVLQEIVR